MQKVVSIVIPNFNRAALIPQTLNSLLAQSYNHWEAIIVDDGSTDDSERIIREYEVRDKRFKYIKRNRLPKGAPTCRNIGVENATGEYIIFLDSDDLLAPYCLTKRIKYFIENPGYDFLVFPMLAFEKSPGDSAILWNVNKNKDDLACFLAGDVLWSTTCPIWKKEAIKQIGGWNEEARLWQDWEFHLKAIALKLKYKKIQELPDCFVRRDDLNDRISKTELQFKQMESKWNTFNKTYDFIISQGALSDFQKKNFAGIVFKHAQKAVIPYHEKEADRPFVLLTKNFSKKIVESGLVPKHIAYLQLTYIHLLLFAKGLKPRFLSRLIRSIIYRSFQKLLPWYLVKNNSELLRHSISKTELEQIKKRLST